MLKFEYLRSAKEILEVQGIRRLLNRIDERFFVPNVKIINTIKKYSQEYRIFVDIGAGIGSITFDVASKFSKCICFEPSAKNYQIFMKNLMLNKLDNIVLYNCALGHKKQSRTFFCSPENPEDNRFCKANDEKFDSCIVQVDTLDNIFESLQINEKCIIKIDVQGSELEVMKGSIKVLEKGCVIISEFWPWGMHVHNTDPLEYIEFMKSINYSFFDLNGKPINEQYASRLCSLGTKKKPVWDDFLIKNKVMPK